MGLLDLTIKFVLNKVRKCVINPKLDGIGIVEEILFKNRELFLKIRLDGLEDHPIELKCSQINVSESGDKIMIGKFECNKKFGKTLLDNFVAGREFEISDSNARLTLVAAKKILGLNGE